MGRNVQEQETDLSGEFKYTKEAESKELLSSSSSPNQSRPTSMVIKKVHTVIPAHLVAEAISTLQLHGHDLRWSGPITPNEMQYVQQYVFAKYPEYNNGLIIEEGDNKIDDEKQGKKSFSPRCSNRESSSLLLSSSLPNLDRTQLDPTSRLLDILNKKTSLQGNFISIPEIQVRNRALHNCGLTEDEYLVVFTPTIKEATFMIGESYPFFRGNYFMTTIISEEYDSVKGFVVAKDSKVIVAPETWLDLRIKGSQLSQYFRNRKCKYSPKGLFAYPAYVAGNGGTRYSMHWISEARRNSWHVVLDATAVDFGKDRLGLALHRPDFVLCTVENAQYGQQPCKLTCLLVRKMSFDTVTVTSSAVS